MKKEWTSSAEHRPATVGNYWVTLDSPEVKNTAPSGDPPVFKPTGRMIRTIDTRYYAAPGEFDGWEMTGEDVKDYHWTEETGSAWHEHVVAWMGPIEPPDIYQHELEDGHEYSYEI